MTYHLNTSELPAVVREQQKLRVGDRVLLSGTVYTARDAAHKRIVAAMQAGEPLPFDLQDAAIYFAGPTAAPPGRPIGACGPTTSGRMDPFSPLLLDKGLIAMIGKGERNQAVCDAVVRNRAVYFCAVGGAGALAAAHITRCDVIAYPELGCESVKRLEFEDFPLLVTIDNHGGNLFAEGRASFAAE
ncbi:MAG: fumarate hydratase C-terminal domain-containing protein [Oscillospiraceae bacterium]|nr:TRZ/ATZ family protein [Ruminococcus sp.]MBQ4345526.1 fumarate hydratase C-terminal domain-containing protein [Oscillospiraceae bacterium]